MEYRDDVFERIVLDDGVFLGAGAVVGPGVEIGPNSVVAAGATVVEDVAAHQLVLGSPPTQEIVSLSEWCE
jgi:acetyltransferase-like isoleucine patch superfamily enzyme